RGHLASPDDDLLTDGIPRQPAEAIAAPVIEDQRYGIRQAPSRLGLGQALTIRPRDLGTIGDVPFPVPLDDRRELVSHSCSRSSTFHGDVSTRLLRALANAGGEPPPEAGA